MDWNFAQFFGQEKHDAAPENQATGIDLGYFRASIGAWPGSITNSDLLFLVYRFADRVGHLGIKFRLDSEDIPIDGGEFVGPVAILFEWAAPKIAPSLLDRLGEVCENAGRYATAVMVGEHRQRQGLREIAPAELPEVG
ncbi:MAG: hypothetical protein U5L08_07895 [Xanthomonadales bacterium]|nr:hypothetical protein [Xanthomonadales bacterium]